MKMTHPKARAKSRPEPKPRPTSASALGPALQQAGLLAALFLSPIIWGRFDALSGAVVLLCLVVGAIGLLLSRPTRLLPPGLPLSSFHLALGGLLAVSLISYFFSVSRFASAVDLARLLAGALTFWLALWAGVQPRRDSPAQEIAHGGRAATARSARDPYPAIVALAFALLVGLGLFSHSWSFYYSLTQRLFTLQLTVLLGFTALAAVFLLVWLWRKPHSVGPLEVACVSAGLVALYGLWDWLYVRFAAGNTTWQPFATFSNPNPLAGFLAVALFLALALLGRKLTGPHEPRSLALPLVALLLILGCLVPTNSKGAFASSYLAGVVFLILLSFILFSAWRKRLLAIAVVLVVLFVIPAGIVAARPSLRAKATGALSLQYHSNMFRYLTWQGTVRMAREHPWVGVGPGAFEYAFSRYAIAGYTRRAHQNYLEVAAETGWPGLAFLVWLMGAAVVGVARALRRAQERSAKLLAAGALAALLIMILHSFLDYDWYIGANLVYFFLACGLGIAAGQKTAAESARPPVKLTLRLVIALLLAVLAGKAFTLGWAERESNQAKEATLSGNYWVAIDHLRTAIGLAPEFAHARLDLAALSTPQQGIPLLEQAISLEPSYSSYRSALGRLKEDAGDLPGALQAFQQDVALDPQHLNGWLAIARLNLRLGRPAPALEAYRRIIAVESGPARKYQAIEYEVKTEYAEAHYNLAVAALGGLVAGGPARAEKHLHHALAILRTYQQRGRGFDQQRAAVGEVEPGKDARLALLQARLSFRMAQAERAAGKAAPAVETEKAALDKYAETMNRLAKGAGAQTQTAQEYRAVVVNAISAEDAEWGQRP